ncbi:MAG: hypothetical protein AB1437_06970 [Pseudomonadota bacterium]
MKKMSLGEGDVVSVKVSDSTYTLAQMRKNGIMQFFDIVQSDDHWSGIDLNNVGSLFFVFVADKSLRRMFTQKLSLDAVVRSTSLVPKQMLSAVIGNAGNYGADLVELTDEYSSYGAKVLKSDIRPSADLELIYRCEMAGMQGDPEKLRMRLERYFEKGINWDDAKSFIFKDVPLPPRRVRDQ